MSCVMREWTSTEVMIFTSSHTEKASLPLNFGKIHVQSLFSDFNEHFSMFRPPIWQLSETDSYALPRPVQFAMRIKSEGQLEVNKKREDSLRRLSSLMYRSIELPLLARMS